MRDELISMRDNMIMQKQGNDYKTYFPSKIVKLIYFLNHNSIKIFLTNDKGRQVSTFYLYLTPFSLDFFFHFLLPFKIFFIYIYITYKGDRYGEKETNMLWCFAHCSSSTLG